MHSGSEDVLVPLDVVLVLFTSLPMVAFKSSAELL